jgi:peptidyl-prolyl cis-trans isomerase C
MTHTRTYAAGFIVAAVAAATAAASDMQVVARIGAKQILAIDLAEQLAQDRRQAAAAGRLDAFTSRAGEDALKRLVDTKLLSLGARDAGLDRRADVKRRLENAIDALLAEELRADIAARADLGERALREYYAAHAADFQAPSRVRARHIVVRTEAEAISLLGRLKRNADFAALAREHNTDNTRASGGDLGWVTRGVMVKPFEDALFSTQVGGVSPVVRTPFGFHLVRVEEIEAPRPKPYENVAADVRRHVLAAEIEAARSALAKTHTVAVDAAVLKSVR